MGELVGYQCRSCEALFLPPRQYCTGCGQDQKAEVRFSGRGVIRTWTTIHAAPARYKDEAPYTVILVELDEGVRLVGRLIESRQVQQGMAVLHSGMDPERGHMFCVA